MSDPAARRARIRAAALRFADELIAVLDEPANDSDEQAPPITDVDVRRLVTERLRRHGRL